MEEVKWCENCGFMLRFMSYENFIFMLVICLLNGIYFVLFRFFNGCFEYVDLFVLQEIDGQVLMLFCEEYMVVVMYMKFGFVFKIVVNVNVMKREVLKEYQQFIQVV